MTMLSSVRKSALSFAHFHFHLHKLPVLVVVNNSTEATSSYRRSGREDHGAQAPYFTPDMVLMHQPKNGDGDDQSSTDSGAAKESDPISSAVENHRATRAAEIKEIEKIARRETITLRAWRLMFMLMMLSMGAMVSSGTFLFIRYEKKLKALEAFETFADVAAVESEKRVRSLWMGMSAMAQSITVAGQNSNDTFPFVRVPYFELPAGHARLISSVDILMWAPLVTEENRGRWSDFVDSQLDWYEESKAVVNITGMSNHQHSSFTESNNGTTTGRDFIWQYNRDGWIEESPSGGPFAPVFQYSPPPYSSTYSNYDILSETSIRDLQRATQSVGNGLLSGITTKLAALVYGNSGLFKDVSPEADIATDGQGNEGDFPHSIFVQPVYDGVDVANSTVVGAVVSVIAWDFVLGKLLPDGVSGIVAVLHNTFNETFTYTLTGGKAQYVGLGNLHDSDYSHTVSEIPLAPHYLKDVASVSGHCVYSLSLYYSDEFRSTQENNLEALYAAVIAVVFALIASMFYVYDRYVHSRNSKMVGAAATSNVLLSSMFPSQIRQRLLEDDDIKAQSKRKASKATTPGRFLDDNGDAKTEWDQHRVESSSKPIADLFTETTILFADIAGFSAWSSVREPSMVFSLLETVFRAFDEIAKRRRVFKVETVGDCYVAVGGVPDNRPDHVVAMARFARECMIRMRELSKKLEVIFGPDTGDLALRIGMHSGPVLAGVLRGDRSRFQLFGDSMNTASRMEQHGVRDRIHLSQETADLLIASGKSKWVTKREDVIYDKSKGDVQTYWLEVSSSRSSDTSSHKGSVETDESFRGGDDDPVVVSMRLHDDKIVRLIKWTEETLIRLLKQIVARRRACPLPSSERTPPNEGRYSSIALLTEEVKDVIALPRVKEAFIPDGTDAISLDPMVKTQLRSFLENVAGQYRMNSFNNFEHAIHVAMAVMKLMSRIVDAPNQSPPGNDSASAASNNRTYGIASDPLAHFSCIFSVLIHGIDHPGVPNSQLVKEQDELSKRYQEKSIAEQHSFNLAWSLLFQDEYDLLRGAIYETDGELVRFRQIVVNSVMAADLSDVDMKMQRNQRWDRAFSPLAMRLSSNEMINRKATVVMEHMVQASHVSHMMQHWRIYRKWNERLFMESFAAYIHGRAATNPADDWYEGEMTKFDFYVLPLAHKLKECGVFGACADEFISYATQNRKEWENRGQDVVDQMMRKCGGHNSNPQLA